MRIEKKSNRDELEEQMINDLNEGLGKLEFIADGLSCVDTPSDCWGVNLLYDKISDMQKIIDNYCKETKALRLDIQGGADHEN